MEGEARRRPDLRDRGALAGVLFAVPAMILYASIDAPPLPFAENPVPPGALIRGLPSLILVMLFFPAPFVLPGLAGYVVGRHRERTGARSLGPWMLGLVFVAAVAAHGLLKAIYLASD